MSFAVRKTMTQSNLEKQVCVWDRRPEYTPSPKKAKSGTQAEQGPEGRQVFSKDPHPEASIAFPDSTISWRPSVQTCKLMDDILHSSHTWIYQNLRLVRFIEHTYKSKCLSEANFKLEFWSLSDTLVDIWYRRITPRIGQSLHVWLVANVKSQSHASCICISRCICANVGES